MLRFRALFILLLTYVSVSAQVNDENLFRELKKKVQLDSYYDSASVFKSGTKAIEVARRLKNPAYEAQIVLMYGNHFYYSQKIETAEKYFRKSYALALEGNDPVAQRFARIRLTYLLFDKGELELAEKTFREILEESRKAKDYASEIECINALALMKGQANKTNEALEFYLQGLKVSEKQNLDYYTSLLLNNMGLLKLDNNQTEEALVDFQRGYDLAIKDYNPRLAGHLQNNIGLVYLTLKQIDEALIHYRGTLSFARKVGHPKEIAISFINYGSALLEAKKNEEAMLYYDSALIVLEKNNMKPELAKGMMGKANILIENQQYSEAISILNSAMEICVETNNLSDYAFSHKILFKAYENKKDYQKALEAFKKFTELSDSLTELQNDKSFGELQVKYDVEKKENDLAQEKSKSLILEKENQLKKVRIRIIISVGIILLSALGLLFYIRYIRSLKKQQEYFSQLLIQNTENERSRIAKDLHDDIGQSLSAIKSKISLTNKTADQNLLELEENVGKIIEQTREISRNLYPSYLEKIGLVRSIARLSDLIQKSTKIECSFEIDNGIDDLSIETRTHLYRIIQECINNTIKHSHASALKIELNKDNDHFTLTYRDNGTGFNESEIQKGLGFYSIKERTRMINGEVQISDNGGKGFKLIVKFIANRV